MKGKPILLLALYAILGAVSISQAQTPEVKALLKREAIENERCRGGSGDDPRTQAACDAREAITRQLYGLGYCYGRQGEAAYQMEWHPCNTNSQTRTAIYECSTPDNSERRIVVDLVRKTVVDTWRKGAFFCEVVSRDGITGSIKLERCNLPFIKELASKAADRQIVEVSGDTVRYGGVLLSTPRPIDQTNRLNLRTGRLVQWDGNVLRCRLVS